MANDILIVDDEADIRDLVAGILEDEGFTTRTSRDSQSPPASGVSRHLAAGQQARRVAAAGTDQEGPRRGADRDDLRARQYRDRGRGEQARRLRLYRKALQVRPVDSGGDAGAGDLAPETRSEGTQATRAGGQRFDRPLGLHESTAPDH